MFSFLNLFGSANYIRSHLKIYEIVRWKRKPKKPFWLGIAKSKMFKIPVRKELPPDYSAELCRLTDLYDKQLRALTHFKENNRMYQDVFKKPEKTYCTVTADMIEESLALNEEWNAQCAAFREEREKTDSERRKHNILKRIQKEEKDANILRMKAEKLIKSEIGKSSELITLENLDKAIDECLSHVEDYNFAVDAEGNIYQGRRGMNSNAKLSLSLDPEGSESVDISKDR